MAKITETNIESLIPDDRNFNRGTEYGEHLMDKSLRKFGLGRSILIDKNNRIIAGNKTTEKAADLGFEKVVVVETDGKTLVAVKRKDVDLDSPKGRELALADNATGKANLSFDLEELAEVSQAMEFDPGDWGINIEAADFNPDEASGSSESSDDEEEDDGERIDIPPISDVLYPSNNEFEIPVLLSDMQAGKVELPLAPWGASSRLNKQVATYHFYVDDYRFEALWKDPTNLIVSGCKAIVEPNCSCHDQTPIAYGLQLIYKKRWLARHLQELEIKTYVDLNVAPKFRRYNMLGVPSGWNAFFTRGITGMVQSLNIDLETAREISGKETPNLVVYGGGEDVRAFCQTNGLLYLTDYINAKQI